MSKSNDGSRFDRLPPSSGERVVTDRPTRVEVLEYFQERFGVESAAFQKYTFWEKGTGKIWAFKGEVPTPINIEALGIHLLRTNQRHWKPTTDAMQRFGRQATRGVIELTREQATRFWRGESQSIEWDGPAGYVLVTNPIADRDEPLGIGLIRRGELRSQIPKGRRRDLEED